MEGRKCFSWNAQKSDFLYVLWFPPSLYRNLNHNACYFKICFILSDWVQVPHTWLSLVQLHFLVLLPVIGWKWWSMPWFPPIYRMEVMNRNDRWSLYQSLSKSLKLQACVWIWRMRSGLFISFVFSFADHCLLINHMYT